MDYDPSQAVAFAINNKPVEFEKCITAGLSDRILDAIEAKRVEVASKIFGTPEYDAANTPVEEPVADIDVETE